MTLENLKNESLTLKLRRDRLKALKKSIIINEALISEALRDDLGKSIYESYVTEIGFILEEINYALKHLDSWTKKIKVKTPFILLPGKSFVLPSPLGVVLIISPWNYPFQLTLSPFIGAIAAGNRVVIKPSEISSKTSAAIKLIIESVFEKTEVQVIEGGILETQALLKQKFDHIFFTGSTEVGKVIMKAASEHLTPVTLELGGKSPLLIEASADIDIAAKRCAWGKFLNAGQTCVAPDYVLVPRPMQDTFIEKLKHHLEIFYGVDSQQSEDYSRIVNSKHFDRLCGLIDYDKIALGGQFDRKENFIQPTAMKDIGWKDRIMEDEIFGPILPIVPYDDLNQALLEVSSRPKPLAFYVFTEDSKKKEEILSKVSFGGGCINDAVIHLTNPHLPFGGIGGSGMGGYHGKKSFDTFTHYKSVYERGSKAEIPLRYPPYAGKLRWLKLFLG